MFCGVNIQSKTIPGLYVNNINDKTIRENFRVDKKNLQLKMNKGLKNISKKKIVICVLARDVEKYITNTEKLMLFVDGFKDYRFVIFENDSKDNTRQYIKDWVSNDKKVILLNCCDLGDCDCKLSIPQERDTSPMSQKRIKNMSNFRNICLQYILSHFSDYDYMMFLDVDIRGGVYRNGFLTCFADDNWDAIFAKGIKPFPFMFGKINQVYDTLAFLDKKNPTFMKDNFLKNYMQLQNVYRKKVGSDNVQVESAFNGAGIYQMKKIIESNAKYGYNLHCEHIDFHKSLRSEKLYANPSFIISYGLDNDKERPFTFLTKIIKSIKKHSE